MEHVKICPHCGQTMMLYRRNIRKNMLWCLRTLFIMHGVKFKKAVDISPLSNINSDFTKLYYWSLINPGEHNTWQITQKGIDFILGRIQIQKYRWIYNGNVQDDPIGADNPLIWAWDIAPEEISKETILESARAYPITNERQGELF